MGETKVFNNEILDSWLNKKSEQILQKVDREQITTEEMLILVLKAQTNHFHHMDDEFRQEFKRIDERFEKIDERFEKIEEKFDKKFDRLSTFLMWQGGIILTLFSGLYILIFQVI